MPPLSLNRERLVALAYKGMTLEAFDRYVREFMEEPQPGFSGMKRGEAFYRPMIQVLELLRENEFSIFICSGTDREVVRSLVSTELAIPPRNVLATGEVIVARDQGDTDGTQYLYSAKDELVLGGKIQGKKPENEQSLSDRPGDRAAACPLSGQQLR